MKISNKTQLYLSCSSKPGNFGATLYNSLFGYYDIDAVYLPRYCIDAKELINSVRLLDCLGCSVSMPLKNQVIPYLDELSGYAQRAQSVNTIVNKAGRLIGHNTDIYGAINTLGKAKIENVIIYGAGSVVDSLLIALDELGIQELFIISRNLEKTRAKCEGQGAKVIESLKDVPSDYDLLINATPAPFGGDLMTLLARARKVFDLVVSPTDTQIITAAKKTGKDFFTGTEMAKYQFQRQFFCYTGLEPKLEEIAAILNELYING
ncbi:MAG: hypothetical protein ABW168_01480 [Sedimenticola sp.]